MKDSGFRAKGFRRWEIGLRCLRNGMYGVGVQEIKCLASS